MNEQQPIMCLFFGYIWIFHSWNSLFEKRWQFQNSFSFSCSVLYHIQLWFVCTLCVCVTAKMLSISVLSYSLTLGLFWALSTRPFFLNLSNQVQARDDKTGPFILYFFLIQLFFSLSTLDLNLVISCTNLTSKHLLKKEDSIEIEI